MESSPFPTSCMLPASNSRETPGATNKFTRSPGQATGVMIMERPRPSPTWEGERLLGEALRRRGSVAGRKLSCNGEVTSCVRCGRYLFGGRCRRCDDPAFVPVPLLAVAGRLRRPSVRAESHCGACARRRFLRERDAMRAIAVDLSRLRYVIRGGATAQVTGGRATSAAVRGGLAGLQGVKG